MNVNFEMYCDLEKENLNNIMPSTSGDGIVYYDGLNNRFVFEFEGEEWFLQEFKNEFYCELYADTDEYSVHLICIVERINDNSMYFKNIEIQ